MLGGVTFDGSQNKYYGGVTFNDGAHDQTWRGFRFVNGEATGTGVIVIGGYQNLPPTKNIRIEDCEIAEFWGSDTGNHGHGVYISQAFGGRIPGWFSTACGSRIPARTSAAASTSTTTPTTARWLRSPTTSTPTTRSFGVPCSPAAMSASTSGHTRSRWLLIEDCKIVNARSRAVCYERGEDVTFRRVVSTGTPSGVGLRPDELHHGRAVQLPDDPRTRT